MVKPDTFEDALDVLFWEELAEEELEEEDLPEEDLDERLLEELDEIGEESAEVLAAPLAAYSKNMSSTVRDSRGEDPLEVDLPSNNWE